MAKYSYEFKLKVVKEYLSNEGGYSYLSKKHGIASLRDISKWVASYKEFRLLVFYDILLGSDYISQASRRIIKLLIKIVCLKLNLPMPFTASMN